MSKPERSWRDFYDIHPAAEFFHTLSSDKQLQDLADDIDKQKVIYNPIHTATVPGHSKPCVFDGISRADAAERTGRTIVDENGKWIGMLDGHFVHHPGKTDEEVWRMAVSLNNKRRHYTAGQLSAMADMLATARRGGDRRSDQTLNLENDRMSVAQAAKTMHVSPASVQSYRKVKKEAPEKAEAVRKGKLSLHEATSGLSAKAKRKSKPKKEKPFEDRVWEWFSKALKGSKFAEQNQERQVMEVLAKLLTTECERVSINVKRSYDDTAAFGHGAETDGT